MAPTTRKTRLEEALSSADAAILRRLFARCAGGNRLRVDNLLVYAAALLVVPPDKFRLPQIAGGDRNLAAAQRRILDEVEIDEAAIRHILIASTAEEALDALIVDSCWVGEEDAGGNLICSISAASGPRVTPVGWAISPAPPPVREGDDPLSSIDGRAMLELVRQCGRDFAAVQPAASPRTVPRP